MFPDSVATYIKGNKKKLPEVEAQKFMVEKNLHTL